jgi:MFS family permease
VSEPGGETSARRRTGAFPLLRDRNFAPYLLGNTLSTTGTWFLTLAQAILIYRLTNSTFLLGVVGFSQYAAVLVLAPITGSVTDRFDRRRVLMTAQVCAFAVTATLTVITALGLVTPSAIIVLAAFLGATNAFATPAMMAFVPSLVDSSHLSAALALNSATFNVGRAVGPVLGAAVIGTAGPTWAFAIGSVSYLALAFALTTVHALTPQVRPQTRPRLRDSIALVRRDRRLLALLYAIAAMNIATDPAVTLGPAFMVELNRPDSLAGLLTGAFGAGAVVVAFTVAHGLQRTRKTIAATLLVTGAGVAGFAVSPTLGVAMVALFVMGLGYLATNTVATSRLQLEVEDAQRGRIMTLWSIAFLGARPIASIIDGAIASWAGVRVATFCMALPALVGAAVFFLARPGSRDARSEAAAGREDRPPLP